EWSSWAGFRELFPTKMKVIRHYGVSILLTTIGVAALFTQIWSVEHFNLWEFSTLEAHWTVKSSRGRVIVMGPPNYSPGPMERRAWNDLKRLQNDQIYFALVDD